MQLSQKYQENLFSFKKIESFKIGKHNLPFAILEKTQWQNRQKSAQKQPVWRFLTPKMRKLHLQSAKMTILRQKT